MFPQVSARPCALSCKRSFTFSPVCVPCSYTREESEQGVPGRNLQCYASRLWFHLDQRHRDKAFMRPLSSIFLCRFPWKPHTVAAEWKKKKKNTPRYRRSHFSPPGPQFREQTLKRVRGKAVMKECRAVSRQQPMEMLNSRKNNSPRGDGTKGGGGRVIMPVSMESKKQKYHILKRRSPSVTGTACKEGIHQGAQEEQQAGC